ncbi:hypothetical protein SMGD1_2526 [Sulfurimonas gotlandica GD1]|jgi:hypothetical protein|uniref:Uncharacterized protein n=1 Tax=Sulfurimonas gotlandica (strain DSM 19862 / JCM 16533 / GD1) TaxID=929558 RepID=H1FZP1_SULGG|nr:hypothetical protein [Sulfurimonas gotlandica]EHP31048.1 hypothetical protein SMGD1_2526 [Sulfurimonas gotlandica GD1]
MQMISYWKNPKEFYNDNGLVLIIGNYDHKNEYNGGEKALGVHWGDYPQSRGILSPCVIPKDTRNSMLSGLLHQATINQDEEKINNIIEAIQFFK